MRKIRHAATVLALGLALAACASAVADSPPPATASAIVSPSIGPSPAPAASPADAAQVVIDAALATMAEGTLRYDVEVRSADPDDIRAPVAGHGQISFGEPFQFRFFDSGVPGKAPPSEVIYDGKRFFIRGREVGDQDIWVILDPVAELVRRSLLNRHGTAGLVLVPPLGATTARAVGGEETVGGVTAHRFVTEVDIALAREHVPGAVITAYESQVGSFQAYDKPLTHELEVWVDLEGRIVRTRYVQEVRSTTVDEAILVTYDFGDFGAPMEAAPPDGAEVLTFDEFQERGRATPDSPSTSP